ncbi:polysaccharide deacetylase family protein [Hyphomicrobium sp. D-2]|uniref:polysaccharide deacetylase family protein n=1 Tax=Hyphomicrobium sp. D-2 TaxID=3041621 RepID=UPI0024567BE4|nr:polysaccharide deacetylase family protein [Hyphomicrobium sp. D-2]MDH4982803.1 polysaccharide deacetylase family protein [Hyphomicrobium sp. D-2]
MAGFERVAGMRLFKAFTVGLLCLVLGQASPLLAHGALQVEACASGGDGIGLSRIVEVDTTGGPSFGRTVSGHHDFLNKGEIVLTFDDGPLKSHTRTVLKALAEHCTKATFFMVGRMVVADPAMVREVSAAGHTVGAHTWTHARLPSLSKEKMEEEIELSFSALSQALEGDVAPFFRFPYLSFNKTGTDYLKQRNVANFTIDIDSRDFRTKDAATVERTVLAQLAERGKGIILFHDIQPSTAKALSSLLTKLKERGFKVVHVVPKDDVETVAKYDERASKLIAHKLAAANKQPLAKRAVTWPNADTQAAIETDENGREILPWARKATDP